MNPTDQKMARIAVIGFFGLMVAFIIGAVTIVLMPFALIYAIGYLGVLIYTFIVYLKNRPDEAKESMKQIINCAASPEAVHASYVRRSKKRAAKQRKKQLRQSKRQARRLVIAHSANKSINNFIFN
ncbi:MAG: dicarboxylate/amino acid:cation symporter [Ruminococcaceae bacterium]|nr:dicarboxylate/amino acid:cation symporter [Oscillospiraceae bacterium]